MYMAPSPVPSPELPPQSVSDWVEIQRVEPFDPDVSLEFTLRIAARGEQASFLLSSALASVLLSGRDLTIATLFALAEEDRVLVAEHRLGPWLGALERSLGTDLVVTALDTHAPSRPRSGDGWMAHALSVTRSGETYGFFAIASLSGHLNRELLSLPVCKPGAATPRLPVVPAGWIRQSAGSPSLPQVAIGPIDLDAEAVEGLGIGDMITVGASTAVAGGMALDGRLVPVAIGDDGLVVLPAFEIGTDTAGSARKRRMWITLAAPVDAPLTHPVPLPGQRIPYALDPDGAANLVPDGSSTIAASGRLVDLGGDVGFEIKELGETSWA